MREAHAYLALLRRHSKGVLDVLKVVASDTADRMARGHLSPRTLLAAAISPPTGIGSRFVDGDAVFADTYRTADWRSQQLAFTAQQAKVIRNLHMAHRDGKLGITLEEALEGTDITSKSMSDVLRRSGAWNALVIPVPGKRGLYRLDLERID